ncbi:MAG: Lrp/AsnC family transcriptional regulator [Candidatus Altiarchaeota archaeon]|nr:Lrp/AsnC family transcriptional regulator [Candidatus Altiarchaeota archaeon]
MVLAYVMVRVDAGKERDVKQIVEKMDEVKESHIIYGEWDIITKIDVANVEKITEFVVEKLRKIEEVRLTSTMIVAK